MNIHLLLLVNSDPDKNKIVFQPRNDESWEWMRTRPVQDVFDEVRAEMDFNWQRLGESLYDVMAERVAKGLHALGGCDKVSVYVMLNVSVREAGG